MFYNPGESVTPTSTENSTVYHKDYRHSIVDSSYQPNTSLLHNVTGQPVYCDYYRQYAGQDEELIGLQVGGIATYQSYTLIKGMIYKRDGDASRNWNAERYEVDQVWMGYFIFDLVPLEGDILIQDIGDGRAGLVQINKTPEPMNIYMDKVYLAECKLVAEMTQLIEDDLKSKVVQTKVFSAESALKGGRAVIANDDFQVNKELDHWGYFLTNHLLTKNYWNPERTVAIHGQEETKGYDPYLVDFLTKVIPGYYRSGLPNIKPVNYKVGVNYNYNKSLTIWDCLLQGNFDILPMVNRTHYIYSRDTLFGTRAYPGFTATRFDWIVLDEPLDFDFIAQDWKTISGYSGYYPSDEKPTPLNYYFSESFYKGEPGKDEFENWCLSFFKDRVIDRTKLLSLCKEYPAWNRLDQLYRVGILLVAINVAKRVIGG